MALYERLSAELQELRDSKRYNNIKTLETPQDRVIYVDGKAYLNMCSNNYLGFANDEITKKGAHDAIEKYGVGPGAVRSISGTFKCHEDFEKALAEFKGVEDVILVQSGFQANTALTPSIVTKNDAIISDELNHASIIDGVRLTKAKKYVFAHKNMTELREKLELAKSEVEGNIFIITDGVFSMDGDIAPLDEINKLAKEFGAYTIIDDAHGEGVLGHGGRGAVSHFGLEGQIDFEVGTLSKAFGIAGGFIGGKKEVIEYLKQKARPFLFSSGVDAALCGAGMEVVKEMTKTDERVVRLWDNAKYLQEKFVKSGVSVGETETPITPVMVGEEAKATELTKMLFEEGILVSPIIFPTVAKGKARIRIMVSAAHTKEDLDLAHSKIMENIAKLG